jgi:hypothetical protein
MDGCSFFSLLFIVRMLVLVFGFGPAIFAYMSSFTAFSTVAGESMPEFFFLVEFISAMTKFIAFVTPFILFSILKQ